MERSDGCRRFTLREYYEINIINRPESLILENSMYYTIKHKMNKGKKFHKVKVHETLISLSPKSDSIKVGDYYIVDAKIIKLVEFVQEQGLDVKIICKKLHYHDLYYLVISW
jgi:hypothetical protein